MNAVAATAVLSAWPTVWLRPAHEFDRGQLLDWRNERETCESSFDTQPVTVERYVRWFDEHKPFMQIAMIDPVHAVGQVRVEYGEVCYSVDAKYRGLGIGTQMIRAIMGDQALRASVKTSNAASMHIFHKLGWLELQKMPGLSVFQYVPDSIYR